MIDALFDLSIGTTCMFGIAAAYYSRQAVAYKQKAEHWLERANDLDSYFSAATARNEELIAERQAAPPVAELAYYVELGPDTWDQPEALVRHNVDSMILKGLVLQLMPHIEFEGPIYTPFQLPRVIGRLRVVKGEQQNEREKT